MLTLEMAIQKIQQFSPEQRNKVIEFIEFLEFQASQTKKIELKNDDSDREQSFFELAGIWSGKNITLDDIRKDACRTVLWRDRQKRTQPHSKTPRLT